MSGPRLAIALVAALLVGLVPGRAQAVFGPPPDPRASAYVLLDATTDEVLASRAPDRALPMASTTKLMTALVVRARSDLDEQVTIPDTDLDDGTVPTLEPGETLSVRQLLSSLLIASDNRAAVALAEHVGGSEERFVQLMNARARSMGLEHTSYANPHGLDAEGHAASAADLVAIGQAVMDDEVLAEIVGRRRATIPGPGGVGSRSLESQNDLLDIDPDADGIKTGMTDDAGYTLVAHARRPPLDTDLYVALLGSPGRAERAADAEALLDWGFAQFSRPTLLAAGQPLGEVAITDRPGLRVELVPGRAVAATVRVGEPIEQRMSAPPRVDAPAEEGDRVGSVVYLQDGRELGRAPVVLAAGAGEPTLWDRVRSGWDELLP